MNRPHDIRREFSGIKENGNVTYLRDIYKNNSFGLSVEIFPPKSATGDASLENTLQTLSQYQPAFISCTYGAGGSTRDRTLDWCRTIQENLGHVATAHFTCVGSSREELLEWLVAARSAGVKNIMALRGDPPRGETSFIPSAAGLRYANELVALIRENHPELSIGVAGYPETHQECPSAETDLENLRRKVNAGADAVFTQMFFTNEHFFRWRDRVDAAGIDVPIVPGIMPITSFDRIKKITAMCGAHFPAELSNRLEAVRDDPDEEFEIGIEHAIDQCRELMEAGVPGMHFYVLNKSQACERIFDALGMGSAIPEPA